MKRTHRLVLVAVTFAFGATLGCTTLGPMPATTGISAVPAGRPGVELQAGIMPGYMLSEATQEDSEGGLSQQLLGLVEPDRWLGTRGLIVGAREVGLEDDFSFEPFLGYRHRFDEVFSLAVVGYAAAMEGEANEASYEATRGGGEVAGDMRLFAPLPWLAVHVQGALSATYLQARGTYCVDTKGLGIDCNADGRDRTVDSRVDGWFPAATASLALDLGRRSTGVFHGTRIALLGNVGSMPQLRDGVETGNIRYLSMGVSLTIGVGDR